MNDQQDTKGNYLRHEEDYKVEDTQSIAYIQSLISKEIIGQSQTLNRKYNLIIARHILEHMHSLDDFFDFCRDMLTDQGHLLVEIPDPTKMFKVGNPSVFWEEHISYIDKESLTYLLKAQGLHQ